MFTTAISQLVPITGKQKLYQKSWRGSEREKRPKYTQNPEKNIDFSSDLVHFLIQDGGRWLELSQLNTLLHH